MEKLVVVVGLIVHIFFKTDAMFLVVFSVGCQSSRLLRSEMGHSLFCYFFYSLEMISCVCFSFFGHVIQMFNLNMSHLIFLLLTPIHMCAHFVD